VAFHVRTAVVIGSATPGTSRGCPCDPRDVVVALAAALRLSFGLDVAALAPLATEAPMAKAPVRAKSAKRLTWEIAENILNTDAARLPRRGDGRVHVAEVARQVKAKWPPERKRPPVDTIQIYVRACVHQWEEENKWIPLAAGASRRGPDGRY
jgi:hypothetical protein